MAWQKSPTTMIRNLKRKLKQATDRLVSLERELNHYRSRAVTAEADAAKWQIRFDNLMTEMARRK